MKAFVYSLGALLLLSIPASVAGQSATTGALAGGVTSSAGATLPNVTVTLTGDATNQPQTATTGADGAYRFSMLAPGSYEVRFALDGFRTARMAQVVVSISEVPTLDAVLDPGASTIDVDCQCHLSLATSSTGMLVDARTITAIPLTTRNFTQVLSMSSGSAADVNNAGTLGRGTRSVNVNGNTSAGAYTLDGAYAPSAVPNPDTISELKIHTSQYDALYGAQVPSTALVTKSGEKEFHGDAWEFVRNDVFNANAFFRNSTGQSEAGPEAEPVRRDAGRPGRCASKLFFFTSYQGTRQVNGLDPTSTSNPILPPLTADRSAAALAAEFCPANHLLPNGQPDPSYLTYAGGKQLDCRDQTTATTAPINPVALRLLQLKNPDGSYSSPSADHSHLGPQRRAGLLLLQPALHLRREPVPAQRRLSALGAEYARRARLPRHHRAVPHLRFASGYPGTAMVPGAGTPQALTARDNVTSLNLNSVLSRRASSTRAALASRAPPRAPTASTRPPPRRSA